VPEKYPSDGDPWVTRYDSEKVPERPLSARSRNELTVGGDEDEVAPEALRTGTRLRAIARTPMTTGRVKWHFAVSEINSIMISRLRVRIRLQREREYGRRFPTGGK
jgi:hypothetical protein